MSMLTKEQKIRQEAGQLRHALAKTQEEKRQMHSDLVAQRSDMTKAIEALDKGNVKEARCILTEALAYRERNKIPRNNRV